jgi:hypothetical protein
MGGDETLGGGRSSPPLSGTVMALMRITVTAPSSPSGQWPVAAVPLFGTAPVNDGVVASRRPASRKTVDEAAGALRRLLGCHRDGELDVSTTPRDIALLRPSPRHPGAGWDEVFGKDSEGGNHSG